MGFKPEINIGDIITNEELHNIFKCGNMGGMRYSKTTNTLVLISDMTKGFYQDGWKDGVLLYTGMGKHGDQVLKGNANIKLYESNTNGIDVYLFEVMQKTQYTYRGQICLADTPYQTNQPDEDGKVRRVWIFPIRPIASEEIENPNPVTVAKLPIKELMSCSNMLSKGDHKNSVVETVVYYRDPYLKEAVKRIADGKCQLCNMNAPFNDAYGKPYLEEHHVVRLADGGSDSIDNVVAVCPNCHRKIHILNDSEDRLKLEKIATDNIGLLKRLISYSKVMK